MTTALKELERYTQARIGGNHAAETTGKFIAAKFEHDTARPVNGYAAPQLHTHAVVFNMTEREDGSTRAIQPKSLFDSQQFDTAVYQAELTFRLRNLGYEIEAGKKGAPEIKGYSLEYLDASSPRRQQIEQAIAKSGFSGPESGCTCGVWSAGTLTSASSTWMARRGSMRSCRTCRWRAISTSARTSRLTKSWWRVGSNRQRHCPAGCRNAPSAQCAQLFDMRE